MITIFSIPKPFEGHIAQIQRNAVASWTQIERAGRDKPQVILMGDETGVADAAAEFGVEHVLQVERNRFGTPLLHAAFGSAFERAKFRHVCYVNGDIVLGNDLLDAVTKLGDIDALAVTRRATADLVEPYKPRDPDWLDRARKEAIATAEQDPPTAIDLFLFPKDSALARDMPPFAVGRPCWDNWMIYRAWAAGMATIDMQSVTLVHQRHDYHHVPEQVGEKWGGPEADENRRLMGSRWRIFSIADCRYRLESGSDRLKRNRVPLGRSLQHVMARHRSLEWPIRILCFPVLRWPEFRKHGPAYLWHIVRDVLSRERRGKSA